MTVLFWCLAIYWIGNVVNGANLCTTSNTQKVARIVFGEARGEIQQGQLEVAYTIVNRVGHSGFPNTLDGVVYQKVPGSSHHQYNTLDDSNHNHQWATAKSHNSAEYKSSIAAAENALCGHLPDPMSCGPVSYCACDPCTATANNRYWCRSGKKKIGAHWFVCLEPNTGQCSSERAPACNA